MQVIEWELELRGTSSVSETDHFPGMRAGRTVPPGERTALVVRQELRETRQLGFVQERERLARRFGSCALLPSQGSWPLRDGALLLRPGCVPLDGPRFSFPVLDGSGPAQVGFHRYYF